MISEYPEKSKGGGGWLVGWSILHLLIRPVLSPLAPSNTTREQWENLPSSCFIQIERVIHHVWNDSVSRLAERSHLRLWHPPPAPPIYYRVTTKILLLFLFLSFNKEPLVPKENRKIGIRGIKRGSRKKRRGWWWYS